MKEKLYICSPANILILPRNRDIIWVLLCTHGDKTYPKMFMLDLRLDARAGIPQLEQSGPMMQMPLVTMFMAIITVSLGNGMGRYVLIGAGGMERA